MTNLPKYAIKKLATSGSAFHLDNPRRKLSDNVRMWKVTDEIELFGTITKTVHETDWQDNVIAKWEVCYENNKLSWYDRI